jgi:predicted PurR-regulated permease PerM
LFVVGVTALIILTAPVVVGELAYFIDNFPLYIKRLQGLATDPNRPWLSKLVGEGRAYAEQSVGELTTLATAWLRDFLRSVWTGGRALISAFSLLVVTPIVACYLIYGWKKMVAVIDNWIPPAQRDTVRALAREIDDTIGGFVIGQGTFRALSTRSRPSPSSNSFVRTMAEITSLAVTATVEMLAQTAAVRAADPK